MPTEDEKTSKNHQDDACRAGFLGMCSVKREVTNGGEDHEADEHPESAYNQRTTTAIVFNQVETEECTAKVNTAENHLRDVAVRDASTREDSRPIVEEVIGASQLLQRLQANTDSDSVCHSRGAEKLHPGDLSATDFLFVFLLDFFKFQVESAVVAWDAVDFRECLDGPFHFVVTVVVAGTFWEEEHAYAQDGGPDVGDAHGDTP